jgi:putative DNA primase/helicase
MSTDTMTILTNFLPLEKIATKIWIAHEDGSIEKISYASATIFEWEERTVSSLDDMRQILDELQQETQKFIIRGKPKADIGQYVRRLSCGPYATFDSVPRHWLMLDTDKVEYGEGLDVVENPAEVIQFIKNGLPEPLRNSRCIYQFSSSQNVPEKIGDAPKRTVSAHLWFWCDRPVSDEEWKRYFKAHDSKVDLAVFKAVQPHYTANPIFKGMADPLPERIGLC